MKKIPWGNTNIEVPAIAVGCMRLNGLDVDGVARHIEHALKNGVNFFDHADIYGGGECEVLFGEALKKLDVQREDLFIQTKCGIVPGVMFDLSKEHILKSVDDSLKRLNVEYLDAL